MAIGLLSFLATHFLETQTTGGALARPERAHPSGHFLTIPGLFVNGKKWLLFQPVQGLYLAATVSESTEIDFKDFFVFKSRSLKVGGYYHLSGRKITLS